LKKREAIRCYFLLKDWKMIFHALFFSHWIISSLCEGIICESIINPCQCEHIVENGVRILVLVLFLRDCMIRFSQRE
jgi:hypothetical protein